MDFSDASVNAFISVIGQEDISCPTESYSATDSLITFDNIGVDGDCFGEALRGQGKDTSKYTLDINSDGTLTFHSDGYPDMKMTKDSQFFLASPSLFCRLFYFPTFDCPHAEGLLRFISVLLQP